MPSHKQEAEKVEEIGREEHIGPSLAHFVLSPDNFCVGWGREWKGR